MALDPHARKFLAMLSVASGGNGVTEDITAENIAAEVVAARRRAFAMMMDLTSGVKVELEVKDIRIPGPGGPLALRFYTPFPLRSCPGPGLVFLHGGGWICGDLDTHDGVCRALAEAGRFRVIAVDYRRAPEHKHPAALLDAEAAAKWVVANARSLDIDPRAIAIAGDSAGANLAASLCHLLGQRNENPFALQVLLCPFLDLLAETQSRADFGQGYFLDLRAMRRDFALCFADEAALSEPTASPLRATAFSGLPGAHIHTAEYDPVRDEGALYTARLAAAGVDARYICHSGMIHQFYAMGGMIPYAATALREIGAAAGDALRRRRETLL